MLVKAVLLFLVAMVVIAWVGRLLLPRTKTCPACGRPRTGPGPCACGRS